MSDGIAILADTHYATKLEIPCKTVDDAIAERYGQLALKLSRRVGVLRALLAHLAGRKYDLIVTAQHARGGRWLVLLEAWFARRPGRMMLIEFIAPEKSGLRRVLYNLWLRWAFAPAVRRAVRSVQVLTRWETDHYARQFDMPIGSFRYVPWPLSDGTGTLPAQQPTGRRVMSSGRAACDWETLFSAAQGTDWELTIVCGRTELERVQELSKTHPAQVLHDIPAEDHDRRVRASTVYVLCLWEQVSSSGHIRMMNAISAGVPIVTTRVKGLDGYAIDGETAIVVEAGNAAAVRAAVNRLLSDPSEADALRRRAFDFARARTESDYYREVGEAVWEAASDAHTAPLKSKAAVGNTTDAVVQATSEG